VRADEARQDDDPYHAGDEDEREVDRIDGEETVRLPAVTELPRQEGPCDGRRAADGGRGDTGEETAAEGAARR
jgi:hypothetical protein